MKNSQKLKGFEFFWTNNSLNLFWFLSTFCWETKALCRDLKKLNRQNESKSVKN